MVSVTGCAPAVPLPGLTENQFAVRDVEKEVDVPELVSVTAVDCFVVEPAESENKSEVWSTDRLAAPVMRTAERSRIAQPL
jgi:hypothetical protein